MICNKDSNPTAVFLSADLPECATSYTANNRKHLVNSCLVMTWGFALKLQFCLCMFLLKYNYQVCVFRVIVRRNKFVSPRINIDQDEKSTLGMYFQSSVADSAVLLINNYLIVKMISKAYLEHQIFQIQSNSLVLPSSVTIICFGS